MADGAIDRPLDEDKARADLAAAHAAGLRAVAIVPVHGWRLTDHETRLAGIAPDVGFEQSRSVIRSGR
ncbi:hydantoinase/oxoprolinase N-terminal domain-containing protein [Brevundimonas vesicularis]|uniref:hydantoinase/oxoprolinase N-terminal domain-containing protein n=1 Tax=Brevundimonas vesicularis TaxID=41276 RepID=UPI00384D2E3C